MSKEDNIVNLSYDQAVLEIEAILQELEDQSQMPIDKVLGKSRRAVALIAHCRKEISKVSEEVSFILKELKEESKDRPAE